MNNSMVAQHVEEGNNNTNQTMNREVEQMENDLSMEDIMLDSEDNHLLMGEGNPNPRAREGRFMDD